MNSQVYRNAKLSIFEKAMAGEITESQRDALLVLLEEKKEADCPKKEEVEDLFGRLSDAYPELKEDIEKLSKKLEKACNKDDDKDEESDDDKDGNKKDDDDDSEEESVSEAALELFSIIDAL